MFPYVMLSADRMMRQMRTQMSSPSFEMVRRGDEFHLWVELPGVKSDDVRLDAHERVVTLSVSRPSYRADGDVQLAGGLASGASEMRFRLPAQADVDAVTASMADGVLHLVAPVLAPARRREIPVGS